MFTFSHSNGESQSMKRPSSSSSSSSSCFWENFLLCSLSEQWFPWTEAGCLRCECLNAFEFSLHFCGQTWSMVLDTAFLTQFAALRFDLLHWNCLVLTEGGFHKWKICIWVREFSVNSETCWINVLMEASFVIYDPCHCSHRWRSDSYRVLLNAVCIEFMSHEQQGLKELCGLKMVIY